MGGPITAWLLLLLIIPILLAHKYIWRGHKEAIKTVVAVAALLAIVGGLAYLQGFGIKGG